MTLQSTVNVQQGFGVIGAFYDDSPKRVASLIATGGTPVVEVKAFGAATLTDVPTDADTIVVGNQSYRFKDTMAAAFDVQIGAGEVETATSLALAIGATGVAGTDYYTGTTANTLATGELTDTAEVTMTAIYGGLSGNAIVFTESADNLTITGSGFLAGGVEAETYVATVGYAYTTDAGNRLQAVVGGSTMFVGILVNPKVYSHTGVDATLVLENGKIGEFASMGHIVVKPELSVTVGYYGFYDTSTGAITGFVDAGAHSGYTLIPNAQYILVDSTAPNGLAVLSITAA